MEAGEDTRHGTIESNLSSKSALLHRLQVRKLGVSNEFSVFNETGQVFLYLLPPKHAVATVTRVKIASRLVVCVAFCRGSFKIT